MRKGELVLAAVLVVIILAGISYESVRGAGKDAEVIIAHPGKTPFDAQEAPSPAIDKNVNDLVVSPTKINSPVIPLIAILNRATQQELENLPGIGPVLAQRILVKRQALGRFADINDILSVSGIGQAKLNSLLEAMQQKNLNSKPLRQYIPLYPTRRAPVYNPRQMAPKPTLRRANISINNANKEELMAVSGIGEMLAGSIIKAREKRGKFRSWRDVSKVSGIGEKRLETLKEHFTVSP